MEQKQLEAEAITLQQAIDVQERQHENIEKFIQKAHKYVGIEELDGYALRELVSAIYVDAPDVYKRQQEVCCRPRLRHEPAGGQRLAAGKRRRGADEDHRSSQDTAFRTRKTFHA